MRAQAGRVTARGRAALSFGNFYSLWNVLNRPTLRHLSAICHRPTSGNRSHRRPERERPNCTEKSSCSFCKSSFRSRFTADARPIKAAWKQLWRKDDSSVLTVAASHLAGPPLSRLLILRTTSRHNFVRASEIPFRFTRDSDARCALNTFRASSASIK